MELVARIYHKERPRVIFPDTTAVLAEISIGKSLTLEKYANEAPGSEGLAAR